MGNMTSAEAARLGIVNPAEKANRNIRVLADYQRLGVASAVAKLHGLTPQRVRQIVSRERQRRRWRAQAMSRPPPPTPHFRKAFVIRSPGTPKREEPPMSEEAKRRAEAKRTLEMLGEARVLADQVTEVWDED